MTDLIPELRTPTAPEGTGRVKGGMPVSRVDGRAKVTGAARYAAEVNRALALPEVWQRLVALGFERMERMDPPAFRAFIARDLETWGPVIRQAAPPA